MEINYLIDFKKHIDSRTNTTNVFFTSLLSVLAVCSGKIFSQDAHAFIRLGYIFLIFSVSAVWLIVIRENLNATKKIDSFLLDITKNHDMNYLHSYFTHSPFESILKLQILIPVVISFFLSVLLYITLG